MSRAPAHTAGREPRDMADAAKVRLRDWLAGQKDSEAKRLALTVAKEWDANGVESATTLFRAECERLKLVRWVQGAVSDMVVAYRANPDLQAQS